MPCLENGWLYEKFWKLVLLWAKLLVVLLNYIVGWCFQYIFGANFDQVWPDEVLQSQTVNMNAYEYHTLTLIGLLNIPDR